MNAKELMIDDLVRHKDGRVIHVSIAAGRTIVHGKEETYIQSHNIEPILLTPEILRKNGFSDRGNAGWQNPDHDVTYYRTFETFAHNVYQQEHIDLIHGIKYVHEMQHALRLCKLNEFADNFEV